MSMLAVLIVDDEALARARMRTLLADCRQPPCSVAGEASDAMQAMSLLRSTACDVVLLDIHMPGADGMQLARELRSIRSELGIIFVTAHAEHAVAAFDLDVLDYLTKPVRMERLEKALAKALQKKELLMSIYQGLQDDLMHETLLIQDRGRSERVPLGEVLYFKAELKYVTVRTAQKSYILDGALNELEGRYGEYFLRIHRNALVAKRAMRALERYVERSADREPDEPPGDAAVEIEGWAVRLHGVEEALLVSRRQLSAVRAAIAQSG
ncbi:MAG: LytTR family DNA-binding domain-containing protein [Burkholderiaceae bacterium]